VVAYFFGPPCTSAKVYIASFTSLVFNTPVASESCPEVAEKQHYINSGSDYYMKIGLLWLLCNLLECRRKQMS